jgi:hypothetical protein
MEVGKSIQKKTEDYERSRDEKYKFEIDILQSKLQSIRESSLCLFLYEVCDIVIPLILSLIISHKS